MFSSSVTALACQSRAHRPRARGRGGFGRQFLSARFLGTARGLTGVRLLRCPQVQSRGPTSGNSTTRPPDKRRIRLGSVWRLSFVAFESVANTPLLAEHGLPALFPWRLGRPADRTSTTFPVINARPIAPNVRQPRLLSRSPPRTRKQSSGTVTGPNVRSDDWPKVYVIPYPLPPARSSAATTVPGPCVFGTQSTSAPDRIVQSIG